MGFLSHPTRPPPKLILVIIPHLDSSIYNRIKFVCDVKTGLLNACTLGSKFAKANDQYYANVALKFNLKLGGRNQYLDNTKIGIIAEGKTMVVGIDVTHPTHGSDNGRRISKFRPRDKRWSLASTVCSSHAFVCGRLRIRELTPKTS